jgi:long-chain acyl-CoA synthetase
MTTKYFIQFAVRRVQWGARKGAVPAVDEMNAAKRETGGIVEMLDKSSNFSRPGDSQMTPRQLKYYSGRGWLLNFTYAITYSFNWCIVRLLFRLSVRGREHLPVAGPFLLTPNHASPLDPSVLAAALPLKLLQNTYWAGKESTVLRNPVRRALSRLTRVIPIAEDKSSLSAGTILLERGHGLVWFPEGKRSLDGRLQPFKPGIALLLARCDVPVFPVRIEGAHDAFPGRGGRLRLRSRISVHIGQPVTRDALGLRDDSAQSVEETLQNLRRSVRELSESFDLPIDHK